MAKIPFFIRSLATECRIANATRDAVHYLADCYRMCADLRLYDEAHYYADIIEENWPVSEE